MLYLFENPRIFFKAKEGAGKLQGNLGKLKKSILRPRKVQGNSKNQF